MKNKVDWNEWQQGAWLRFTYKHFSTPLRGKSVRRYSVCEWMCECIHSKWIVWRPSNDWVQSVHIFVILIRKSKRCQKTDRPRSQLAKKKKKIIKKKKKNREKEISKRVIILIIFLQYSSVEQSYCLCIVARCAFHFICTSDSKPFALKWWTSFASLGKQHKNEMWIMP